MSEHEYLTGEDLHRRILDAFCIQDVYVRTAYVNRIVLDIAKCRADLKAAQEENRKNLELWDADAKDKDEEIARLRVRAENAEALFANAANLDDCEEIRSRDRELDRMRTALEDAPHDRNCNGAFGRDPLYPCNCWKSRALNPQPSQQEKA